MSFGKKVEVAVRALKAEGKLPSDLRAVERHKRVIDKLKELGHDPRTELPSRRTLARHIDRLLAVDATRPDCPFCTSTNDAADGISEHASDPTDEGHEMQSNPRTMISQAGVSCPWEQTAPWDHGLDAVLAAGYLDPNYLQFRERDRVEIYASDFSWMVGFLVVSKNVSARTVSTLLTLPPVFLLRSSDRSQLHIADQFQKAENAFREGMSRAEYEARVAVLQSLRDFGRYPSAWLADKLMQLNRALDAERLTRQQHDRARQELYEVMFADQMDEVNAIICGEPPKASVPTIALVGTATEAGVAASTPTNVEPKATKLNLVVDEAKPKKADPVSP